MNRDYEKAYNYVKNAQKSNFQQGCCCSTRSVIGPTGPTGPATINVGTTTQGLPGSSPSVVNAGTSENAILNFVIPAGPIGPTGPQGVAGAAGEQGPTGPTGPTGPQGIAGTAGEQGPTGPTGPAGPQGIAGAAGEQGPTGPTGPTGPQGIAGTAGEQGPTGPTGPTGPAINLQIGTVTTGNPGTNAAATINSLGNNTYSLDLTIPQGPTGPVA